MNEEKLTFIYTVIKCCCEGVPLQIDYSLKVQTLKDGRILREDKIEYETKFLFAEKLEDIADFTVQVISEYDENLESYISPTVRIAITDFKPVGTFSEETCSKTKLKKKIQRCSEVADFLENVYKEKYGEDNINVSPAINSVKAYKSALSKILNEKESKNV